MAWMQVNPGESGEGALAIQNYLISLGFMTENMRTGVMDARSVNALRAYQTSIGQVADGIAWRIVPDGTPGSQANPGARLVSETPPPTPPAPTPAPPTPAPPTPAPGPTPGMQNANAIIRNYLDQWGLGSLAGWVWQKITGGAQEAQILLELREQDAYKQRFSANVDRRNAGMQPLSEAEYLAYERQAAQLMRSVGLPSGFYDQPSDFNTFLKNDVSINELNQRIQTAARVVEADTVDPMFAEELQTMYGIDKGARLAYVLDPARAMPLIERQVAAAQASALGRRAGLELTTAQAERIGTLAPSLSDASRLIGTVQSQMSLANPLPTEQQPTIDVIGAVTGLDATAAQNLERRRRQRIAAFSGEGGFASSNQGAVGLGEAAAAY